MERTVTEQVQLLEMLERFLRLPETDMKAALSGAATLVAEALSADKVDAFLFDASRSSLVALGVSEQPLSRLQQSQGVRDLQRMLQALGRVDDLTAELLDVARIDHGLLLLHTQPTDLVELLRELAEALSSPEAPIDVHTPERLVAAVDAARIRQCLENLLSNARVHSPLGSRIALCAAEEMREGGLWARIEVKDQGPGIPQDVLPHIFERFAKGRRSTGLGLGLYLAKQMAALHGGSLAVASRERGGTRFTLMLPVRRDA